MGTLPNWHCRCRVQSRIAMVYTCAKCETRSVKTFSRQAYEKGLVLVRQQCTPDPFALAIPHLVMLMR
jgi:hypothetical protein